MSGHASVSIYDDAARHHHETELLAFQFWLDRGAPLGTPEVDWFRAEEELKRRSEAGESTLTVLAEGIGSALGSIVAAADAL